MKGTCRCLMWPGSRTQCRSVSEDMFGDLSRSSCPAPTSPCKEETHSRKRRTNRTLRSTWKPIGSQHLIFQRRKQAQSKGGTGRGHPLTLVGAEVGEGGTAVSRVWWVPVHVDPGVLRCRGMWWFHRDRLLQEELVWEVTPV